MLPVCRPIRVSDGCQFTVHPRIVRWYTSTMPSGLVTMRFLQPTRWVCSARAFRYRKIRSRLWHRVSCVCGVRALSQAPLHIPKMCILFRDLEGFRKGPSYSELHFRFFSIAISRIRSTDLRNFPTTSIIVGGVSLSSLHLR